GCRLRFWLHRGRIVRGHGGGRGRALLLRRGLALRLRRGWARSRRRRAILVLGRRRLDHGGLPLFRLGVTRRLRWRRRRFGAGIDEHRLPPPAGLSRGGPPPPS